ncbi:LexA family protein [Alcaligenes ammonioxydans]|nr:S24 family peptidase [Alcaligenes ammonioxydans]
MATAHFLDDVFCVHASSIDNSKQKEKKHLNQCLVFSCFNHVMDIYATRRRNLQQLIDDRAQGNAADFARSVGRERAQIAQYLSPTYNSGRSIGERVARAIEKEAELEAGSLDRPEGLGRPKSEGFDANVIPAAVGERRIPLLNYVQAGVFCDPGQNFTFEGMEYLLTDLDLSERAFALQIKGDSMQPDFREGDRIIVDCEVSPRPGDFVVAKNSDEEATFKKYRLLRIGEDGQEVFELVPLNQDYPSMRSDQHHVQIIGTMVEHRKYYRRS